MFDTESGQVVSETHSLCGRKSRVPLEPGTEKAASGTCSLRGQKGRIASEPGIRDAASRTHSLSGQKKERLALDTGEFVTYLGK